MTQQVIDVGPAPGTGGDPGRIAMQKVNANFAEVYGLSNLTGILPVANGGSGLLSGLTVGAATAGEKSNNTSIINAALATGQRSVLPSGIVYTNGALVPTSGCGLVGVSQFGSLASRLINDTGNVFAFPASLVTGFLFEGFSVEASAGHIFSLASSTTIAQCDFKRLHVVQYATGKSIMDGPDSGLIEVNWDRCDSVSAAGATVPSFKLLGSAGQIACNIFQNSRHTAGAGGTYVFEVDQTVTGSYCYDNIWRNWNFEGTEGGCIKALTHFNSRFEDLKVYDLPGATTADLFHLGKYAGAYNSRYCVFRNVGRRGGALGGGLYDISLGAGEALFTIFEGCDNSALAGFKVNLGPTNFAEIHGSNIANTFDNLFPDNTFIGRQLALSEVADSAAPDPNGAIIYARDNGGGKTQICVRFNTGAIQVIATQP